MDDVSNFEESGQLVALAVSSYHDQLTRQPGIKENEALVNQLTLEYQRCYMLMITELGKAKIQYGS